MSETNLVTITAKNNEGVEASIVYDFGGSVEKAIEMFGAQVVYDGFVSASKITAQACIRRELNAGKDEAYIVTKMEGWKPGVKMTASAVDPIEALKAKFRSGGLSDEEKQEILAEIMGG